MNWRKQPTLNYRQAASPINKRWSHYNYAPSIRNSLLGSFSRQHGTCISFLRWACRMCLGCVFCVWKLWLCGSNAGKLEHSDLHLVILILRHQTSLSSFVVALLLFEARLDIKRHLVSKRGDGVQHELGDSERDRGQHLGKRLKTVNIETRGWGTTNLD